MVKIKNVAEAAGVSTATVSRVLANKPHVRPEVKKRVLEVVRKLNYQPNRVAQSLRSSTSKIIALVVADIENPFFQRVSRAVDDYALEEGYNVMLCNTDEDAEREKICLELLHVENIAGIILSPTRQGLENFDASSSPNVPTVIIDRDRDNFEVDNVLIDNVSATQQIISHLIDHGHRRLAGIFGENSSTGLRRRDGFLKALKEHDIKPAPELIKYAPATEDGGYHTAMKLLKTGIRPDALFTSSNLLSVGALLAIQEHELEIPNDIAFASFDDATWTRLVKPPITVVQQPTYEIGRTAAELLIKRINDPSRSNREVVLTTKMVIRESCGCSGGGLK